MQVLCSEILTILKKTINLKVITGLGQKDVFYI